MNRILRTARTGALASAFAVLATSPAVAQDLPAAQDLIDRYVEAVGGRAAATASIATHTTGTFEMAAMGVSGDLMVVTGPDNSMATRVTIPGIGEMRTGYTGEVGWSMDPMTGARLLEGGELEAMQEQTDPLYNVRDASLFQSVETVGEAEYGGEACWQVHYVRLSGRETTDCFSKESGLVVATIMTQETPMGDVEVVTILSDYRRFGDLLVPTSMRQSAMGQEQVMTITDMQRGDAVDLSLLEPPAAILTLIQAGG